MTPVGVLLAARPLSSVRCEVGSPWIGLSTKTDKTKESEVHQTRTPSFTALWSSADANVPIIGVFESQHCFYCFFSLRREGRVLCSAHLQHLCQPSPLWRPALRTAGWCFDPAVRWSLTAPPLQTPLLQVQHLFGSNRIKLRSGKTFYALLD